MKTRLYQLWDRLSLYLPILLMSQLALGTWWLVRSTPKLDEPSEARQVQHQSDYQLQNFSIQSFDPQGRFKNQLWGAQALHYPDTDALDIRQVRLLAIDDGGNRTQGTAERADVRSSSTQVRLQGQVHLVRSSPTAAPLTFESATLDIDTEQHTLHSPVPVVITQAERRFSANRMDYRHTPGQLELQGQVRTTFGTKR